MQKDVTHHAELRECLETMRQMKEKYITEIEHLHHMNSEALVAVRVAEYESGTEITRLREEYRAKHDKETVVLAQKAQQLQVLVDGSAAKHNQLALCLEHLLAYVVPLQMQLANLSRAYNTLKLLHQNSDKVANGVMSLAQCCRPQSSGSPSGLTTSHVTGKLRGEYIFEPFLDPLEEVSAPKTHVKVTFRVAVIYVLAALRLRRIMRAEKHSAASIHKLLSAKSRCGSQQDDQHFVEIGVSLPEEKELRARSSVQVARQLIDAVKNATTESGTKASPAVVHQDSMDEFDAYLASYERHLDRRNSPAGASGAVRKSKLSLFDALSSPNLRAQQPANAENIYQLRNVSLLYKTLADMSNRVTKSRADNEQLQVTLLVSLVSFLPCLIKFQLALLFYNADDN